MIYYKILIAYYHLAKLIVFFAKKCSASGISYEKCGEPQQRADLNQNQDSASSKCAVASAKLGRGLLCRFSSALFSNIDLQSFIF